VCWMSDAPMRKGGRYLLKHTTRTVKTIVEDLRYRIDGNTLPPEADADGVGFNAIGRVRLRTSGPLMLDDYRDNRSTGGFILIDEASSDTVAAGMVVRGGPGQRRERGGV